jgi:phenylalanyl-tRNA synthetase beta chain
MLVSWEWLADYVTIGIGHDEMATTWALTGLNHESTEIVRGVPVIDLEITSNRGDCLGHIGIAREASVLLNTPLRIPDPQPQSVSQPVADCLSIENRFVDACPRYVGRIIRGVKVGPSPDWLRNRLESIGVKSINNVVDVTNYVMFECGQPLHAFDFAKIRGGKIIVRPASDKESFVAIDHRTYQLDSQTIVIADAERAVALGGVMGGVESEVSDLTVDVLIEAAEFVPLAIRRTARKLKLHSPSSYRFERKVDGAQLDWASRRCCELILQVAAGELLTGAVDTAPPPKPRESIVLRKNKVASVLGIDVPWDRTREIVQKLGCKVSETAALVAGNHVQELVVVPPSFRADLTREIDLIEEIARIYGYDKIPEDASVPMVASAKRPKDVMMQTVRTVACAAGFDETLTPSLIGKSVTSSISPWSTEDAMSTIVPLLEGASQLRRSLIPSLITARQFNQSQSNRETYLFETANVYLAAGKSASSKVPQEKFLLGVLGPAELRIVAGLFEEVVQRVCGKELLENKVQKSRTQLSFLATGSSMEWKVEGRTLAWFGILDRSIVDGMKLDCAPSIGEIDLDLLLEIARLVPQLQPIIPFPTIERDLNLIVDEGLEWQQLAHTIQQAAGPLCIGTTFREIYRDTKKDGIGKKRVLLSMQMRSPTQTLASEQADEVVARVLEACASKHSATLLPVK